MICVVFKLYFIYFCLLHTYAILNLKYFLGQLRGVFSLAVISFVYTYFAPIKKTAGIYLMICIIYRLYDRYFLGQLWGAHPLTVMSLVYTCFAPIKEIEHAYLILYIIDRLYDRYFLGRLWGVHFLTFMPLVYTLFCANKEDCSEIIDYMFLIAYIFDIFLANYEVFII